MSRRSPTRARIDAARTPGVEHDRVATARARRMDDAQLQQALQRIPKDLAVARAAKDPRALTALKRHQEALKAEADARGVAAGKKKSDGRKKKDRVKAANTRAQKLREEYGEVRMKVVKRVPPSRNVKASPAAGMTQVVRGGSPGLGKRS